MDCVTQVHRCNSTGTYCTLDKWPTHKTKKIGCYISTWFIVLVVPLLPNLCLIFGKSSHSPKRSAGKFHLLHICRCTRWEKANSSYQSRIYFLKNFLDAGWKCTSTFHSEESCVHYVTAWLYKKRSRSSCLTDHTQICEGWISLNTEQLSDSVFWVWSRDGRTGILQASGCPSSWTKYLQ